MFRCALSCYLTGIVVLSLCAVRVAEGYQAYQALVPNGNRVVRGGSIAPGFGHVNRNGGGIRTVFGSAFAAAGHSWTTALCQADSDGDGFTNGQELGDPSCVWTQGATPSRTQGISDPGIAEDTPPPITSPPPGVTQTPAPPATTAAPATIPADARVEQATGLFDALEGRLRYNWTLHSDPHWGQLLAMTLEFPATMYGAVGVASEKMNGRILVATMDSSARGHCGLWQGFLWNVRGLQDLRASATHSRVHNGRAQVTCLLPASHLGITSGSQRTIYAIGNVIATVPRQHGHGDFAAGLTDFAAGTSSAGDQSKLRTIALGVYVVVIVAWLVTGIVLWAQKRLVSPRTNQAFGIATVAMYVLLQAMFAVLSYYDIRKSGKTAALGRVFGGIGSIGFMWALYPVPKHFGVTFLVGSSYERAVPYHIFFALCLFTWVTVHFGVMTAQYLDATGDVFSTAHRYGHMPLLGFLAWLLMAMMILVSLFARRASYAFFRVFHLMWVAVVACAAVHVPTMLLWCAIPLLNYAVDLVLRFVSYRRLQGTVSAAQSHPAAHVSHITVQLADGAPVPGGSQFGLWTFGEALVAHPFSVAWFDPAKRTVELFIKSNGESTFTGKLLQAVHNGTLAGRSAGLTGFYGSLQVPPANLSRMLLVAGGIGVTPMLNLVCCAMHASDFTAAKTIRFVWVVRDSATVQAIMPKIAEALSALRQRLEVEVFVTAAKDQKELSGLVSHGNGLSVPLKSGRPDVSDIAQSCWPEESGPVGIYTCGPEPLMDLVSQGALSRPGATYFHKETFSL